MAIHPSTLALIDDANPDMIEMLKCLARGMNRLSIQHDGLMTEETEGYHREFIEAIIKDDGDVVGDMGEHENERVRRAVSVGYTALWELTEGDDDELGELALETINNFLQRFQDSEDPNVAFHAGFHEYDHMGSSDLYEHRQQYTKDDIELVGRDNGSLTDDEKNSLFPNGKHPELERFIQRNPDFPLVILSAQYGDIGSVLGMNVEAWHMFVMHVRDGLGQYSFLDFTELL